jgi:hypothetical protein
MSVDTIARALQLDPTHLIDIANPLIAPSWALVETFYRRRCKYGLHQCIYRTEDVHDRIVLFVDDIPRKRAQTVVFSFFCFSSKCVKVGRLPTVISSLWLLDMQMGICRLDREIL